MEHVMDVHLDGSEIIATIVRDTVFLHYYTMSILYERMFTQFLNAACPEGSYGLECDECVGHCKDNKPCNHSTGLCDNGCFDGWKGMKCDEGIYLFYFFLYFKEINNDDKTIIE